MGAHAVHGQQQGLAGAKAAVQQHKKQRVVAQSLGPAPERVALALRVEDRVEVLEHAARQRAKGLLTCGRRKCHLLDAPLQVLQPVTDILELPQRASGRGDVPQGAQHESARGMPPAADGALLDRGQVLLAEQERFERAGDRIGIEPGEELVEYIGAVNLFDMKASMPASAVRRELSASVAISVSSWIVAQKRGTPRAPTAVQRRSAGGTRASRRWRMDKR